MNQNVSKGKTLNLVVLGKTIVLPWYECALFFLFLFYFAFYAIGNTSYLKSYIHRR